jgi:hypothetical protein
MRGLLSIRSIYPTSRLEVGFGMGMEFRASQDFKPGYYFKASFFDRGSLAYSLGFRYSLKGLI